MFYQESDQDPDAEVRGAVVRLLTSTGRIPNDPDVTGLAVILRHRDRVNGQETQVTTSIGESLGLLGLIMLLHAAIGCLLGQITDR